MAAVAAKSPPARRVCDEPVVMRRGVGLPWPEQEVVMHPGREKGMELEGKGKKRLEQSRSVGRQLLPPLLKFYPIT